MINDKFWLEIGVNTRMLNSMSKNWFKYFKKTLAPLIEIDEKLVCRFFNIKELNSGDIDSLREIFNKEEGKIFYGLYSYLKGKNLYLKEFFETCGLDRRYIENTLLGLMYLYLANREEVINSYYYILYYRTKLIEVWNVSPEIEESKIRVLNDKTEFLDYTKKYRLGRNRLARKFKVGSKIFYCFEKAKKEAVESGFEERINIRKRGMYFIRFNENNGQVEVRTGNPKIADMFFEILEVNGYKVFLESVEQKEKNIKKIINKVINYDSDIAKIIEVDFNSLEKGIRCKCVLKENNQEVSLKDCLSKIVDEGLIDPENINNIRSFTIELSGFSQKIIIERDEDSLYFNVTNKNISETKYNEIVSFLRKEFGIEIRTPYGKDDVKISQEELFSNIIGKLVKDLSKKEREMYTLLTAKNLIDSSEKIKFVCKDDRKKHIFYKEGYEKCPECGGELTKLEPREYIKINETSLLSQIKSKLGKIYGDSKVEFKEFNLKNYTQEIIRVKDNTTEFYVYIEDNNRTKDIINKLDKSLIPSVKVILGKKSKSKEKDLNSEIYAYDFVFDKEDKIKKELTNKLIRKFEDLLVKVSEQAKEKLEKIRDDKIKSNGDEFEDLCYPILKRCFYGMYKWGKNQKRKPVPDGLYGIRLGKNKTSGFSMIYDCKYSEKQTKLNRPLKLQAKDYIRRTNKAEEIESFSNTLSAYMIISNKVTDKQFKYFTDMLKKLRSWNGKLILFKIEELLTLYEEFMSFRELDSPIRFNLGVSFSNYIKKTSDRVIIIDDKVIKQIISDAKKLSLVVDDVEVLNHLETDVDY